MVQVELDLSPILKRLKLSQDGINRIVEGVCERQAIAGENWMKTNAPWQDQTTNARNGLAARYMRGRGDEHAVVFFHQVPYGFFLEVRWEGRYAIIGPAVNEFGQRIMQSLEGTLSRLPGGS